MGRQILLVAPSNQLFVAQRTHEPIRVIGELVLLGILRSIELEHVEEWPLEFVEDSCDVFLIQKFLDLFPLQLFDLSFLLGRVDVFVHLLLEPLFVVFLELLLFVLPQDHGVSIFVCLLETALDFRFLFCQEVLPNLFFHLSFDLFLPRLLGFLFLQFLQLSRLHLGHLLSFNSLSRLELLPLLPLQFAFFLLLDPVFDLLVIFQRHLSATEIGVFQLFLQSRVPLLSLHFLLHRLFGGHCRQYTKHSRSGAK